METIGLMSHSLLNCFEHVKYSFRNHFSEQIPHMNEIIWINDTKNNARDKGTISLEMKIPYKRQVAFPWNFPSVRLSDFFSNQSKWCLELHSYVLTKTIKFTQDLILAPNTTWLLEFWEFHLKIHIEMTYFMLTYTGRGTMYNLGQLSPLTLIFHKNI